jgi:antibiotic biosynthesis monooxygenase
MYAVVRRYRFDPKNSEEIDTRIKDVFVHLLRKAPGFEAYYWLDTGEGEGVSLSVFRDKAGAEESTRIAANFVEEHLASFLGKPEIIQGELHARADRTW